LLIPAGFENRAICRAEVAPDLTREKSGRAKWLRDESCLSEANNDFDYGRLISADDVISCRRWWLDEEDVPRESIASRVREAGAGR